MSDRKRQRPENSYWSGKIREPYMGNEIPLDVRILTNSLGQVVAVQVANREGIRVNFKKGTEDDD